MAVACHCVLCGIQLDGMKRRLFCPVEGVRFVQECCRETPFLQAYLSSRGDWRHAGAEYMCIPCVNWKRRVLQGGRRRGKKPLLQLDRMILFLMQPGMQQEPDMRCMERLIRAIRQPDNPYVSHVFPTPVRWIVGRITGDTFHACIAAWWEYNGRTEFFASAREARRVRCALKAGAVSGAI